MYEVVPILRNDTEAGIFDRAADTEMGIVRHVCAIAPNLMADTGMGILMNVSARSARSCRHP